MSKFLISILLFTGICLFPELAISQCTTNPTTEAVRNGDFEAGYLTKSGTGHVFTANGPFDFQSDLTSTANFAANPPTGTCLTSIGNMYAVGRAEPGMTCTASPRQAFAGTDYIGYPGFPKSFNDHTPGLSGNGFALIGDFEGYTGGKYDAGAGGLPCIWRQQVTVYPNEKYFFSAWFANYNRDADLNRTGAGVGALYNTADLNFVVVPMVAGVPQWASRANLGTATPTDEMVWQQFYGQWTPGGVYTQVLLLIEVQSANATNTNDIVVDDISFINGCSNLTSLPASSIPDLGAGFSLCTTNGVATLNSNVATSPTTQFWWYSGTGSPQATLVSGSLTANTYAISAPGTYRVCTQNSGLPSGCSASSTIVVTATMPPVVLADAVLCSSTTTTLSTSVTGTGLTYNWYKEPSGAPTSSTNSLTTGVVGTYGLKVIPGAGAVAIGCATVTSNDANVTSNIATASFVSSVCSSPPGGSYTVSATGSGNTFTWYSAASGGSVLGSGSPATIALSGPTTIYVENSTTSTIGPTKASATGNDGGGGASWNQSTFVPLQSFTLVSVWVQAAFGSSAVTLNMTQNGSAYATSGSVPLSVGVWKQITLNWVINAGSTYVITFPNGGDWLAVKNSFSTTSYGGLFTLSPNAQGNSGAALDWTVRQGSPCLRAPITLDCSLPVTYISFQAQRGNEAVHLNWITATEKDAKDFIVERSANGRDFYPVGSVTALNRAGGAAYNFDDVHPLSKKSYYRLHQTDLNGESSYSEVKTVEADLLQSLSLTPNPAAESVLVSLSHTGENTEATLVLYNTMGQEIKSVTVESSSLENGYALNLTELAKGAYLLKLTTAQEVWTQRLIKE
jgi:hypothetical protein